MALFSSSAPVEECQTLSLQPMSNLTELTRPDDNWTGITPRSERKKRQNRLNQRAYRRRREAAASKQVPASTTCRSSSAPTEQSSSSSNKPNHIHSTHRSPLQIFTTLNHQTYPFPLTPDHLILLIQYNLFRACLSNMSIVQLSHPDALIISPSPSFSVPESFKPTFLQRSVMHPAWIDSIPHPVLRDNFIREAGAYDPDVFWADLVGDLHESYSGGSLSPSPLPSHSPSYQSSASSQDNGNGDIKPEISSRVRAKKRDCSTEFGGLLCWGDPWDIENYEITERHLRRWWRLHRGCEALFRGTNRWRALRGERPLGVEGFN